MSDEKRCDCCQRYWYYDDLVSGLCPNCVDFFALKNKINIEQGEKIKELETKLVESETKARNYAKEIAFLDKKLENLNNEFELAQEHNEKTVEYWQNECSQLKQQLAEKDKTSLILFSMLYETLEKQGYEDIASQIDQITGLVLDKQADWFKCNRNYDQLEQQLVEKEKEIEELNYRLDLKFVNYTNNEAIKWLDNQTAIAKLEKVKDFIVKSDIPTERKTLTVRFINQQIKELKGDK